MRDSSMFKRLLLLLAAMAFVFAGCSSDGSTLAERAEEAGVTGEDVQGAAEEVGEGVGEAIEDAGQAVEDAGQAVEDAAAGEEAESDSLPTWVIVLLVALVILALIGIVLGLQNRNARKTQEATEDAIRQAQQDQQGY